MQFAFRWMNCLLMREISVDNTIRMWDTYLVSLSSPLTIHNTKEFYLGRRRRRVFTISSLCLLSLSC
jgi:hypothetical protein